MREKILQRLEERLEEERQIQASARKDKDHVAHKISKVKQRDLEWFRRLVMETPSD